MNLSFTFRTVIAKEMKVFQSKTTYNKSAKAALNLYVDYGYVSTEANDIQKQLRNIES